MSPREIIACFEKERCHSNTYWVVRITPLNTQPFIKAGMLLKTDKGYDVKPVALGASKVLEICPWPLMFRRLRLALPYRPHQPQITGWPHQLSALSQAMAGCPSKPQGWPRPSRQQNIPTPVRLASFWCDDILRRPQPACIVHHPRIRVMDQTETAI